MFLLRADGRESKTNDSWEGAALAGFGDKEANSASCCLAVLSCYSSLRFAQVHVCTRSAIGKIYKALLNSRPRNEPFNIVMQFTMTFKM